MNIILHWSRLIVPRSPTVLQTLLHSTFMGISFSSSLPYPDHKEHIAVGVGDVEDSRARQAGHCSFINVVLQHVLNIRGVAIQVETLRNLASLLGIIQSHNCKYWLNVQVKPMYRAKLKGGIKPRVIVQIKYTGEHE